MRPEIQALRAIAVLLVVIYHFWPAWMPGGYAGVDVFFVISGFLITRHLVTEAGRRGKIALVSFWARRARRLLPASLLIIAISAIGTALWVPRTLWDQFSKEMAASAFYVVNWQLARDSVDYLGAENDASPVQHYWSLSVEEQFYLLWPAVLIIVLRKRLSHARMALVAGAAALVDAGVRAALWPVVGTRLYTLPMTWADALFIGGAIAAVMRGRRWLALPPSRLNRPVGVAAAGGFAILVAACFVPDLKTAPWLYIAGLPVLALAAGSIIVASLVLDPVRRVLSWRPVVWVGDLSYSIYLWNFALFVVVERHLGSSTTELLIGRPISMALTLVAAAASYYLVERPSGRLARRLRWLR